MRLLFEVGEVAAQVVLALVHVHQPVHLLVIRVLLEEGVGTGDGPLQVLQLGEKTRSYPDRHPGDKQRRRQLSFWHLGLLLVFCDRNSESETVQSEGFQWSFDSSFCYPDPWNLGQGFPASKEQTLKYKGASPWSRQSASICRGLFCGGPGGSVCSSGKCSLHFV